MSQFNLLLGVLRHVKQHKAQVANNYFGSIFLDRGILYRVSHISVAILKLLR